jgi:hypothetical protein
MVFKNIRLFFLGSEDFTTKAKLSAAQDLNSALEARWPGLRLPNEFHFQRLLGLTNLRTSGAGPAGCRHPVNEHPPFSAIVGTVADDLGQDHSARDQPYQFLWTTELSDGTIFLRPLHPGDAADHLAGENDAMAKWLSGKVSGAAKNIANIGGFRRRH